MADEQNTDLGGLSDEALDAALSEADFGQDDDGLDEPTLEFGEADEADEKEEAEEEAEGEEDETDEEESESEESDEEESDEDASDEEDEEQDDEEETELAPETRDQIKQVLETVEMLKAQNERLQSEVERERLLRDRNAGKLGSLMQQLKKGSSDDDAGDLDDEDDAEPRRSSKDPEVSEELQEIRVERVNRAIGTVSQEFLSDNQKFFGALEKEAGAEAAQKFHADLVSKIKEHQDGLGEDIFTMSPKLAAKVAKTVIQSAFADVKLDLMREYQKRAAEKSEKSRREIRARKKGAAGARSNKRPAAAKTKTKSLSDMSDAELEKALAQASFDD